ncbi:MAG: hypothetical protein H6828_16005 [Planctomycetes bacterium]|nr:hypothetical protein [Planctomycetota bacterium]
MLRHALRSRASRAALGALVLAPLASAQEKVHVTWLWHMEQPVYWPDQQVGGADRYELAWGSILRKDAGAQHPANDLREIFSKPDRVAAYQGRVRDALAAMNGSECGVQVSFSGGLIENLQSLGAANQLGYAPTWYSGYREARGWTTGGTNARRCDLVRFAFHHALGPLIDDSALRMELALHAAIYPQAWGGGALSQGFFPSEMAFSTRMIPALADAGVSWTFVSGEKLSRACADFPVVLGSGGIVCDPPNPADQLNPAQGTYFRRSISRGVSPAEAAPFGFTPHRAQYVDPETGAVSEVVVVPCSQSLGWDDGAQGIGVAELDALQPYNPSNRPMLLTLAHDGDNFFAGGYSYYMEVTPGFVAQAGAAGYQATVVEEYLADHPVPASDVVHVEDGAWVNADGDFGAPQMLNWNWPPMSGANVDIPGGWAEDIRNWAVITAAQNWVDTAEQLWRDGGGSVDPLDVLSPGAAANAVERAWHYHLAALNSGYMYYGTSLDMEVKPTIACNEALQHAAGVVGDGTGDTTPPTVWIPQRYPWNPGGSNYGPLHGYTEQQLGGDFWVWTFVHDVSDVTSVRLRYRLDADGANPLADHANELYAGGPGVGAWQALDMTRRPFPTGNVTGNPSIDFFELPTRIADEYYVELTGLSGVLVDYYVEATDTRGNVRKSPIQHVWVGTGGGSTSGDAVTLAPDPPLAGQGVEVRYDASGGPLAGAAQVLLHHGFDGWSSVHAPDTAMSFDAPHGEWVANVTVPATATQLDFVFTDGQGAWDNHGGADWHAAVQGGVGPGWTLDGALDADAQLVGASGGASLWAGVKNGVLYVATEAPGAGQDRFVLVAGTPGALRAAPWAKSGQAANWSAFLAAESQNGYHAWFDANGATDSARGAVLEGTLDLAGELGLVPAQVAVALALYDTPDGGALDPLRQVAATLDGDGDVDAGEYALVATGGCQVQTACSAGPTSTGTPVSLALQGSASVAAQSFTLVASGGPAGQPALFFHGGQQIATPFGNGVLCVGGGQVRLNPPTAFDAGGTAQRAVTLGGGTLVSGATRWFQVWFRDPAGGGAGFDLSEALEVRLCD